MVKRYGAKQAPPFHYDANHMVIPTLGRSKMRGASSTKVVLENKNKWRIFLSQNLLLSVGRRKSAVAKVAFVTGTGKLIINDKDAFYYLQQNALSMAVIQAPLKTVSFEKKYNIVIKVQGGGLRAQAEAIQLGIARALCSTANTFRTPLKEKGFLRRDPREKERKKYGLKKARKAEQYSKR